MSTTNSVSALIPFNANPSFTRESSSGQFTRSTQPPTQAVVTTPNSSTLPIPMEHLTGAVSAALRGGAQTVNVILMCNNNINQFTADRLTISHNHGAGSTENPRSPNLSPFNRYCSLLRWDSRLLYIALTGALALAGCYTCLKTIQLAYSIFNAAEFPFIISFPAALATLYIGIFKISWYILEKAWDYKNYTYSLYTHSDAISDTSPADESEEAPLTAPSIIPPNLLSLSRLASTILANPW